MKNKKIPIIDLFAGPGGLGEGFSALKKNNNPLFEIKLSIEKEENAHKTLVWRSFYRQFVNNNKRVPDEYYDAYRERDLKKREFLIEKTLNDFPEGEHARYEAQLVELGSKRWPSKVVDKLISDRLGNEKKDWVLIGGPPCQAYSNVGRSRVGGINSHDSRVYLYKEYLRIIEQHNPAVFVMENVKGLLSAKVGDEKVFDWMKEDLNLNGEYTIHSFVKPVKEDRDYLIKSENYGVPQKRHRVILLGIRNDMKSTPAFLKKSIPISLESIIDKLPSIRSGLSKTFIKYHKTEVYKNNKPKRVYENVEDNSIAWEELMFKNLNLIKEWGDISVNDLKKKDFKFNCDTGSEFEAAEDTIPNNHPLKEWFFDKNLKGVANHESRAHLTQDLMRYFFASLYVKKNGTFPRLCDFAKHHQALIPEHSNVASGKFTDRFRVQVPEIPATTITSHISKDGHYFIHYDPSQCRSLTVREAARVQTFPDNYLFRGSRTAQYHQVGNAVPPYLAYQLAEIVYHTITENRKKE